MGRRFLFPWVLLSAGAALAGEPRSTKTQVSSNGRHAIRFLELDGNNCRIEVVQETSLEWQLDRCVGTAEDLYFVSNDGSKFWVLLTLPEKPARQSAPSTRKSKYPLRTPWFSTVVAVKYDKSGAVLSRRKLSELVAPRAREEMRQLEKRFKWLAGVVGEPGKGPRINDKDQVELETLGATFTSRLGF